MKKILWNTVFGLTMVGLCGCGIPQKSVPPPRPAPMVSVQRPPVGVVEEEPQDALQMEPPILEEQLDPFAIDEEVELVYPSLRYVNSRIFEYGRKLARWKELDKQSVGQNIPEEDSQKMVQCFREIQDMLNRYGELRSKMMRAENLTERVSSISSAEIFELQRDEIGFLEKECGALLVEKMPGSIGWSNRDERFDLDALETLIARHTDQEQYEEVVQAWLRVPKEDQDRVGIRTLIRYGNALMYLHQEEKAADMYRKVVDEMVSSGDQAIDIVSLRRVLADLYTAGGNYRAAGEQYKKISEDYQNLARLEEWSKLQLSILDRAGIGSPELSEYSSLLRNFLGFIPRKDGYNVVWQADQFLADFPYSPVNSNIDFIKEVSSRLADEWFAAQLVEIERLVDLHKFQDAQEYLESIPADIIGPEKQLELKKKKEEILLVTAVQKETERLEEFQGQQRRWNEAMLLARDRQYDEAIVAFKNLGNTDFAEKAAIKVEELMLEAAQSERKRAAQLYIRYTKTTDFETQKQLLVESRKVLKDILEKYPEVEIRSKVLDNLSRVEQEMNTLDPRLLLNAEASPEVEGGDDGVGAAFQLQPASRFLDSAENPTAQ